MKTMIANRCRRGALALLVPVLLAAGMFLGGCESDTAAPQDPAPVLSEQDVAKQSGYVAMAVATVGPELLSSRGQTKNTYQHTFSGDVTGSVWLDFRLGGADGVPANWSTADWGHLYTEADAPLNVPVGYNGSVALTFDITAGINRGLDRAVLGGGGTFQSGVYEATFAFTDLTVTAAGDYPTGGSMSFTGSDFAMTVAFNGTRLATITVSGHGAWSFNLDTLELKPLP